MARSNHSKGDPSPSVTNGYPCHENGISLCAHVSKRKRLQKPKLIKENESAQVVVEKLLKSEHCNSVSKTQSKPCRRSERKTIPNSLWDNAVINPFFERKRRKLAESPSKSPPITNGKRPHEGVNGDSNSNGVIEYEPDKKSEVGVDFSKSDSKIDSDSKKPSLSESSDGTSENSTSKLENLAEKISPKGKKHVRLRRSSRKHSSTVSSISDTKYTIKQEFEDNSIEPVAIELEDVQLKCEGREKEKSFNVEDCSVIEKNGDIHDEIKPNKKLSLLHDDENNTRKRKAVLSREFARKQVALKCSGASKLSPVKELVIKKISPPKSGKAGYQHVSGCKENFQSVDDEIDVKTSCGDPIKPVLSSDLHIFKGSESDDLCKSRDGNLKLVNEQKTCIDTLGQHAKKRGRRSNRKAPLEHSESEESSSTGVVTTDRNVDEICEKPKSLENEITLSKEAIISKEALQLIDGSSFQRFYKMRTRRQNSSNEQIVTPEAVPSSTLPTTTTTTPKRRSSSRSNSSNSKISEEATSSTSGETKKRPKHVKPDILCSFCLQTEDERGEEMISCCLCGASGHPSCLQFSVALTQRVKLYRWECIECKKCELCRNSGDDATLLFCDDCDKGFHMSCLNPPLNGEPDGHWSCLYCVDGSDYWKDKSSKSRATEKSRRGRKSDKVAKRKRLLDDLAMFHEAQSRAQAAMTDEAKLSSKPKGYKKKIVGQNPPTIKTIELGCYEITTWYSSPYPAEYALQSKLYICEFCLKYMKSGVIASRHTAKCPARCPPGDEIYRKDSISVFEVDGRKNKTYCQNLCLLAKLFLDHKTLYYDVEPFLFYILTEYDRKGCHIVGYFSKEKNSFLSYNVSCILVLPPYMKKGYGKMLIDFSYALSRKEGKLGSPEKPLSDLGLVSYRNYWKERLLEYFLTYNDPEITIKHMSQTLGFNPYDIVSTLQAYGMIKYHKSNHYVLKRPEMLSAYKRKVAAQAGLPSRSIDMAHLKWIPPAQRDSK